MVRDIVVGNRLKKKKKKKKRCPKNGQRRDE
jgi:hypothetical protein